jgi:starch synthase (maltosyl-transferring)
VLATTLFASYGIYGPAFELREHTPREAGSEEYAFSEKYEVRHWDLKDPNGIGDFVARMNEVRRAHPALQHNDSLRFHPVDNEALIAYSKRRGDDIVVVVVNLDPVHRQSGWVELDLHALGIDTGTPFDLQDLLTGARYRWEGSRNFVILDPASVPAHVFTLTDVPGSRPPEDVR